MSQQDPSHWSPQPPPVPPPIADTKEAEKPVQRAAEVREWVGDRAPANFQATTFAGCGRGVLLALSVLVAIGAMIGGCVEFQSHRYRRDQFQRDNAYGATANALERIESILQQRSTNFAGWVIVILLCVIIHQLASASERADVDGQRSATISKAAMDRIDQFEQRLGETNDHLATIQEYLRPK